ncbi:hypothetical protein C4578_01130 [Candidatus Microgenomates bacterium]|jgi:hypothetical protein|nr:MAG: hypothetical protein C4578_01130 [Candidatus Microgenomates bacterium]
MKLLEIAYKYLWVVILVSFFFLYSYKLTEVPPGINFDEASIGYNAALISDDLHDENGRLLPVFILTLDGKDWKQPSNVYFAALIFKILGKSYFNLRLISVIYAVVSGFLFYKLLRLFVSQFLSLIGLVLYLTAPSMMIQSHLVLENMALLPFFMVWLYFLLSYSLKPKPYKALISGIFLGISFYSYKGMRAMVPVYLVLSVFYFLYLDFYPLPDLKKIKALLIKAKPLFYFLIGIGPFLLPVNWLNSRYAGAVYDPRVFIPTSLYESALIYFGNFDFSFLFAKGDSMLTHSTGRHGIFLGPTFFLFFLGLFQLAKEKKHQYYFVFLTLILTPVLLMRVGSVYRASRLMMYIPLATFIFTLGVKKILEYKTAVLKYALLSAVILSVGFFYSDFLKHYFGPYPKRISQDFSPNFNEAFKSLAELSRETGKTPYVEYDDYNRHFTDMQFFREVFFPKEDLKMWPRDFDPFPENGLVLTSIGGSGEIINYKEIPALESGQRTFFIVGK